MPMPSDFMPFPGTEGVAPAPSPQHRQTALHALRQKRDPEAEMAKSVQDEFLKNMQYGIRHTDQGDADMVPYHKLESFFKGRNDIGAMPYGVRVSSLNLTPAQLQWITRQKIGQDLAAQPDLTGGSIR